MENEEKITAAQLRMSAPRQAAIAALWFAMPFGALWSLGVDPVVAAQASVLPFVCAACSFAFVGAALSLVASLVRDLSDG